MLDKKFNKKYGLYEYYGFFKYEWFILICVLGAIIIKIMCNYCF